MSIEEGKTLFIKLVNVSLRQGRTLNGDPRTQWHDREAFIVDKGVAPKAQTRPKADLDDPLQVGAPIPGLIVTIAGTVGQKVAKGDRLLMMEAMKMQTTVYAPADGIVDALYVQVGDSVESKDLLVKLRE